MDVKSEVLLQLFNKSKLSKRFLSQNFSLLIVKFKKLGFSTPLNVAFQQLFSLNIILFFIQKQFYKNTRIDFAQNLRTIQPQQKNKSQKLSVELVNKIAASRRVAKNLSLGRGADTGVWERSPQAPEAGGKARRQRGLGAERSAIFMIF